jgi:hypothetical protein
MIAVVFHCSLTTLAVEEATIEGTVQVPCDPSRVSDIALVQIWTVSGELAATVEVDSSTGMFRGAGLTEGEYEVIAIGADGEPLSPKPMSLLLRAGPNTVVLSMQPPGCGEQDSDFDGVPDAMDSCPSSPPGTAVGTDGCSSEGERKPGKKDGLKAWQLTLIYVGVVGVIILALYDDDEERASPF